MIRKTFLEFESAVLDESPMHVPIRGRACTDSVLMNTHDDSEPTWWCDVPSQANGVAACESDASSPAYLTKRRSYTAAGRLEPGSVKSAVARLPSVPEKRPSFGFHRHLVVTAESDDEAKTRSGSTGSSDSSTGSDCKGAAESCDCDGESDAGSEFWEDGDDAPGMARFVSVNTCALDDERRSLLLTPRLPMTENEALVPPPGLPVSCHARGAGTQAAAARHPPMDIQGFHAEQMRSWQLLCAAHSIAPGLAAHASAATASLGTAPGNGAQVSTEGFRPQWVHGMRADGTSAAAGSSPEDAMNTTLMLRNMPNNYTRKMLLDLLDRQGFRGVYDLVYLPVDFNTGAGLGYSFVNLTCPADVPRFWAAFDGFKKWRMPSEKVCAVTWSRPHQGLAAHVDRYRNSPVMHPSIPDNWKPVLFAHGSRIAFPPPTKPIRPPVVGKNVV